MITRRQLLAFGAAAAVSRRALADGKRSMPCGFVGHGSPMLAIDPVRGPELRAWGASLPKPAGIVAMTPHYRSRGLKIGHVGKGRALYSFPDFMRDKIPRDLDYASPDNAALAHTVADLLAPLEPTFDEPRAGFDHTTWMPLRHMFPDASAPVVEIAMPFMQEKDLMTLGRRLAPLRHQNVFILASGSITHNLASMGSPQAVWAQAFDDWAEKTLHARDDAALLDWRKNAPNAELAHPDDGGHFRVLLVAYGASSGPVSFPAHGFEGSPFPGMGPGSQSKRCIELA